MSNQQYAITFIGHVCYDEITPFAGDTTVTPGSAVLCGAMVAARVGSASAVITRMHPEHDAIIAPLRRLGVTLFVTPCAVTTFARVLHP